MTAPKHSALPSDDLKERLLPCPFCNGSVQFRKALHISDGNVDSIIHATSMICPMVVFEDGSTDESILSRWNTRVDAARIEALEAQRDEAQAIIVAAAGYTASLEAQLADARKALGDLETQVSELLKQTAILHPKDPSTGSGS